MCQTCGCAVTHNTKGHLKKTEIVTEAVTVLKGLLAENDHQAAHNRQYFDSQGVLVINLMSSPGSGKTSLLEATIEVLRDELTMAVIEGDLETENDAQRIRAHGVEAVQITTGSACHLDAHMVHDALHDLTLAPLDILFIENVGNLVCPAGFDLGQHHNVTLLSVPEGDDKPAKYPVMFRAADLVLLTKIDLLPVLEDFKVSRAENYLRQLASAAPLSQVSSKTHEGLDVWINWLKDEVVRQQAWCNAGQDKNPMILPDRLEVQERAGG